MRSTRVVLTLAFTLLMFFSLLVSRAQGQGKNDDADSAAIKQVVAGFMSDFNRHDAHAISAWFTEDCDYTNGGGMTWHSRKGIEEHYASMFATALDSFQRTAVNVKSIRFLTPEIASVDINYDLGGSKTRDGSPSPPRPGLYDWTLVKQNGHWLIAILHEIGIGGPAPVSGPQR